MHAKSLNLSMLSPIFIRKVLILMAANIAGL